MSSIGISSSCACPGNTDESCSPHSVTWLSAHLWESVGKVALAGNPNVGKSVFFNAFTGQYANVSNFPGTTVDITSGMLLGHPDIPIQDTPGIYGMSALSEEESVAEATLRQADVIVNVVSALTLERDLFLTQQLIDHGYRIIVAVNQLDEAAARHVSINLTKLSSLLGVPVFGTIATSGQGLNVVLDSIPKARQGLSTPDAPPDAETMRSLEQDMGRRLHIYGLRRQYVNSMLTHVVSKTDETTLWTRRLSRRIGQLLLHPVAGLLTGLVVMFALYQIIGIWVAGDIVNFTEKQLMLGYVVPFMKSIIGLVIPAGSFLDTVLAGEFGVLTMSVQYIFGVLFPLVLGFYIYMSILEDCGYLPRIAVLADGLLSRIGLNGRAVIPMILGFGCVTMATVSTRVLTSQRERTIASTLLAITIPCSAQIGVIVGLMALAGGLKAWAIYIGVLTALLLAIGTVLNSILPGRSSSLLLDLPPMRLPRFKNIARKTWVRTVVFLKEAAPLFMLGSLIVSVVQAFGWLSTLQLWLTPLTVQWLHLPAETANAFLMGMVRRDFGAAGMYFLANHMTPAQILTSLIVITLFVPCIASATVMTKERGAKEGMTVLFSSWALAFLIGGIVARMLGWFM